MTVETLAKAVTVETSMNIYIETAETSVTFLIAVT